MADCSATQEHRNITTEYQQKELQRMISENCGLQFVEEYYYDGTHHSSVLQKGKTCVILDYNLCSVEQNTEKIFDYSKYCEMQNAWMMSSDRLYRFYVTTDRFSACNEQDSGFSSEREDVKTGICSEINRWLTLDPENIEVAMMAVPLTRLILTILRWKRSSKIFSSMPTDTIRWTISIRSILSP